MIKTYVKDGQNGKNKIQIYLVIVQNTYFIIPGGILLLILILLIMIIAFKGAIQDYFYILLAAPRTASKTYAQVATAQSCANHVQHIERLSRANVMLRATWYERTAQLLSLTEFKSHLF